MKVDTAGENKTQVQTIKTGGEVKPNTRQQRQVTAKTEEKVRLHTQGKIDSRIKLKRN